MAREHHGSGPGPSRPPGNASCWHNRNINSPLVTACGKFRSDWVYVFIFLCSSVCKCKQWPPVTMFPEGSGSSQPRWVGCLPAPAPPGSEVLTHPVLSDPDRPPGMAEDALFPGMCAM